MRNYFGLLKDKKTGRTAAAFLLVFALIFIRYCYFGFEYYYQLDDYIQYHNYTAYGESISSIVSKIGMLGSRPLAGVLDITVWTHFYQNMLFGVALISAMYAASACFFRAVWSRHFGTGWIFTVIYALLPLGFEGTYWMSAATRVVVGLFFASISLYCFEKWCSDGRARYAVFYAITQLLAFAMYEQILVLSFTATILLAVLNFKESRRRVFAALFAPVAVIAYFAFTGYFVKSSAVFSNRVSTVLPFSSWYFEKILPVVLSQIKSAFFGGGFYTLARGFGRGVEIMLSDFNLLYITAVLLLCAGLFFLAGKSEGPRTKRISALIIGLLLVIAPVTPFFILESPWLSLRGTVASFCGIALICDTLFGMVFTKLKAGKTIAASFAAAMALVFCVSSISELHDYKETTKNDMAIVSELSEALRRDGYSGRELKIGLLNVEKSYLETQNYFYHEHIHGVTESDWAMTGALEASFGRERPIVVPISANPMYVAWNKEAKQLSGFKVLYLYLNGEFIEVTAETENEGRIRIVSKQTGEQLGFTYEDGESAFLVLN